VGLKKEKSIKIILVSFLFSLSMVFPTFTYSVFVQYRALKEHYMWLTPERYKIIYRNSIKFNIPVEKICSIIKYESNGNSFAVSVAFARGLMQIMPCHYNGPVTDLFNDELNIYLGTKYYRACLNMTGGNHREALRYYNAGPSSNRSKYKNWRNYVEPIIASTRNAEKEKYKYLTLQ